MNPDWKRRFTWIEMDESESAFLKEPFPHRGHRGDLGPLHLSISRYGMINPIIARVRQGKLQVICGYRRWLAAQVAGVQRIPVIITSLSDDEAAGIFAEEEIFRLSERSKSAPDAQEIKPDGPKTDVHSLQSKQERSCLLDGNAEKSVAELYSRVCAIFETVQQTKSLPAQLVDELTEELCVLDPMACGVDIRDVGPAQSEEDGHWLAAHGLRVAILSLSYGSALQWNRTKIIELVRASLLHDIGMLFVPSEWFHSPFPLTREREEALRKHTVLGQEILQQSEGESLAEAALVARDHHERFDGTGYPSGRSGAELSELAQIIGLLDSYAAMVSKREYRSPYLLREAIHMLRDAARVGIFQPDLVRSFREAFSICPVGMHGTLADGAVVRVEKFERDGEKTHLVRVIESGARFREGEELWWREEELVDVAKEIPHRGDKAARTSSRETTVSV